MGSFHHPTASFVSRLRTLQTSLFTALFDMWLIVAYHHSIPGWHSFVPCIGVEVWLLGTARKLHHDLIQSRCEQLDIMHVRSAGDERERDAKPVDQQAALAPLFFPDP